MCHELHCDHWAKHSIAFIQHLHITDLGTKQLALFPKFSKGMGVTLKHKRNKKTL